MVRGTTESLQKDPEARRVVIRRRRRPALLGAGITALCAGVISAPVASTAADSNSVDVARVGMVTVTASIEGWSCGGLDAYCSLTADVGAEVTLTATADPGWTVSGWGTGAGAQLCSGSGPCTFTMPAGSHLLGSNMIVAVAAPDNSSPGVTLSDIGLPAAVQGGKLTVWDISTDGRYLLYTVDQLHVRWHDITTGEDVALGDVQYDVVAMSGDGQTVVWTDNFSGGNRVVLWDAVTRTATQLSDFGTRPSISANGRFITWMDLHVNASTFAVRDRTNGATAFITASLWLPVLAPDGSSVAVTTDSGFKLLDPSTGELLREYDVGYPFYVLRISPNGDYAFGNVNSAPSDQLGFRRVDLTTGEVIRVPRTFLVARYATTALNDGSAYFTSPGTGTTSGGPLADGQHDYYMGYRADFASGMVTVSSTSGVTLPLPPSWLGTSSVVATPDGQSIVFATENQLPVSSQPVSSPTRATAANLTTAPVSVSAAVTSGTRLVLATKASASKHLTLTKSGAGTGTLTPNPTGTMCGMGCTAYTPGTSVTITATPDPGSVFVGWTGACTGTGACTVTMDQARDVTAQFASAPTATPRNASLKVSWSPAAWPAPGRRTGFQVQCSADSGTTWKPAGRTRRTAKSITVTRLRNGTEYRCRVRAVSGRTVGAWIETAPATPRTVPGRVRALTVLPGDGSLTVAWTAPTSNGGAPITGYRVQTSTNGRTWSTPPTIVAAELSTVILTDLPNGVKRYVRVIALNIAGAGKARASSNVAPSTG